LEHSGWKSEGGLYDSLLQLLCRSALWPEYRASVRGLLILTLALAQGHQVGSPKASGNAHLEGRASPGLAMELKIVLLGSSWNQGPA
jgi:hypothetical protein